MEHNHVVYDSDVHFLIDPTTRKIRTETSRKTTVIQYDHNSERFTFDIPRYIEGHDMSKCTKVEVHYLNVDARTKDEKRGVYVSDDLSISETDANVVSCSWLISSNATQLVGTLNFIVRYCCVEGGIVTYAWNTAVASVAVSTGIDGGEFVSAEYADVLETWKAELFNAGYINASTMQNDLATLKSRMDTFTKLPNGSTSGDAELADIRNGANGKTYDTAGNAIRSQFEILSDKINSSFLETGFADKYVSACKIYTDEYEYIMISDIRRKYVANNDGGKTSIRIYSCDETGKVYTQVATVELPLDFEKGTIEYYFGQNSFLSCYVDLTSLDIGGRLTGDGEPFVLKRECFLPTSSNINVETLKSVLLSACNTEPKKILTWVDDDTHLTGITSVKTICDSLGIKCTFATITKEWNESLLDTLHQYQKEGFHITSHTEDHGRWYKDTDDGSIFNAQETEEDLLTSLEKLKSEGFIDCDMLVYPGSAAGRSDVNTIDIVKKWCRCGVLAGGTTWNKYGQGKYKINRTFINKSSYDTSYYTDILDSVTDESWVVLGTHSGSTTEFDSNMMTDILSHALENGWVIMTLNEALKYREKYYHIQEILGL